jgi:hypothetical protein
LRRGGRGAGQRGNRDAPCQQLRDSLHGLLLMHDSPQNAQRSMSVILITRLHRF